MNIWFEFTLRLVVFLITFYYLLEYILTCKVDTNIGLLTTFILIFVILLLFKYYTCKQITKCETCKSTIPKNSMLSNTLRFFA